MSNYLHCYEIYEGMNLEIKKQRVIKIFVSIVWVLDVKKVACEQASPFANVGASQADNDNSNPPEIFNKKNFLAVIDWAVLYSYWN